MTPLELLAPAKNLECGRAAIDHGADAVYIGPSRFGARSAVGNSLDDICKLCSYAHPYGVKVYATVNTMFYDHELDDARQLIGQLYEGGVDAILIQDMRLLDKPLPPIALHASTQTDNRTPQRVGELLKAGFSRIVLARELSVDEIAAVHAAVPDMALEVFVHGALCVSYSGLCYASEYCFGRSANRGTCAQFCRMKFDLVDADGQDIVHQRYLLSLKDLNLSDHLEELARAGATSFKIEGRLKDATYVKNVTAAYSQRLDAVVHRHPNLYCRASLGHSTYTFMPNVQKSFNRGFTTYFLHGRQPHIFSPDTPKALGEAVGRVKELRRDSFNVAGTASFTNGDGLCFLNDARELEGFRVNRAEGNRLYPYPMPQHLKVGTLLYRNNDQQFERLLSRSSAERKIPLDMLFSVTDDGFSLAAHGQTVSIVCDHQMADHPQRENIERQLGRMGGTPYELSSLTLPDDFPYFVPSSRLSDLRRQLVAALSAPTRQLASSLATPCRVVAENHSSAPGHVPAVLMQCRHCLRYSLGYCVRHGGQSPTWREPLSLRLSDGRMFPLEFDCRHCQMNVLAP